MKSSLLNLLIFLLFTTPTFLKAQATAADSTASKKIYITKQVAGKAPVIDGKIDDPVWNR